MWVPVEWRKLLAVMRYAVKTFGMTQFVINSLMKCVPGEDNYNGQKNFVNDLCYFAQNHNVHVHLVHHLSKAESKHRLPGKFDVKVAGAITDQIENVVIVWWNKAAERGQGAKINDPSAMLACEKQRNGEYDGVLGFLV